MRHVKEAARIIGGGEFDIECTACSGEGCSRCNAAGYVVGSWGPTQGLTAKLPKRGR